MKVFHIVCVIQLVFLGYLSAQSQVTESKDSVGSRKDSIIDYRPSHSPAIAGKTLNLSDRLKFTRFRDSIMTLQNNPLAVNTSFDKFSLDYAGDIMKIKLPERQKVYFAIQDYSAGINMSRVSRRDNPFFDDPQGNSYLWSGGALPHRETGFSKDFFNTEDPPAVLIRVIRDKKGFKGFCIDRLEPDITRSKFMKRER